MAQKELFRNSNTQSELFLTVTFLTFKLWGIQIDIFYHNSLYLLQSKMISQNCFVQTKRLLCFYLTLRVFIAINLISDYERIHSL